MIMKAIRKQHEILSSVNNNNNKSTTIQESSAERIPGQHTQRSAEGVTLIQS